VKPGNSGPRSAKRPQSAAPQVEQSPDGGTTTVDGGRASGAALHGLLNAAPVAMVVVDDEGGIVAANVHADQMFGYDPGELTGVPMAALIPDGSRDNRALSDAFDVYGLRKGGEPLSLSIGVQSLATDQGGGLLYVIADASRSRRFNLAIDAAPAGIVMVDPAGKIVLANGQFERQFGYARDELTGRPLEMLLPAPLRARHEGLRALFAEDHTARTMGRGRDLHGLHKDGREIPVEIGLSPLNTPLGRFVLATVIDISERKRTERDTLASLREKEVLLKEIHHRVKNNLQVISSLLRLRARTISDEAAREVFAGSQERIEAMALVHERLYQSRNLSRVDFREYAQSLVERLAGAHVDPPERVRLALDVVPVELSVELAIPLGLLLNELVTNALKHAFAGRARGELRVALTRGAGPTRSYVLTVGDDGVGLPESVVPGETETLGMELVATLADQIDAKLTIRRDRGTTFELAFDVETA